MIDKVQIHCARKLDTKGDGVWTRNGSTSYCDMLEVGVAWSDAK